MSVATETIQRKYVLVQLGKGDYMFAGNDGRTYWRVRRYTDGPSAGLDWPKDRQMWGAWRWVGCIDPSGEVTREEAENEDSWDFHEGFCDTRAEAIQAALRSEA